MIGIIGAMDKELFLFFEEMTIEKTDIYGDKTFYIGKLKNHEVVIVKSGIGKVNAAITTTILATHYNARIIINTGIAGGLTPSEVGDIILAKGIAYFDVSLTNIDDVPYGKMADDPLIVETDKHFLQKAEAIFTKLNYDYKIGNLVSGDKFVTSSHDIRKISRNVDDIIGVEMEGMAIAITCHKFNIPFISVRGISDVIDSKDQSKVYEHVGEDVANKTTEFTFKLLEVIDD